jgi:hypothetical protein
VTDFDLGAALAIPSSQAGEDLQSASVVVLWSGLPSVVTWSQSLLAAGGADGGDIRRVEPAGRCEHAGGVCGSPKGAQETGDGAAPGAGGGEKHGNAHAQNDRGGAATEGHSGIKVSEVRYFSTRVEVRICLLRIQPRERPPTPAL